MKKKTHTIPAQPDTTEERHEINSAEETTSPHANIEPNRPRQPFPIVGIGASAGGLEALELFLGNIPARIIAVFLKKRWPGSNAGGRSRSAW
jgi:chemotaxis response regulator CheB